MTDDLFGEVDEYAELLASLSPERLVSLLSHEKGDPAAKVAWLRRELPLIVAMAMEDHPEDQKRQKAAIRSRIIRHFRHAHKTSAPRVDAKAPPNLNDLHETGLIARPTWTDYQDWRAAGEPQTRGWWKSNVVNLRRNA